MKHAAWWVAAITLTLPSRSTGARRYVSDRVVLLGDAAHVVHPLAGQGLNLGLMDSAALAQVMDGRTHSTLKFPDARLRRFERMRRGENLAMLRATSMLNALFSNNTPIVSRIRGLGLRAVDRAGLLKSWLILRAMGDAGDVPQPALRAATGGTERV